MSGGESRALADPGGREHPADGVVKPDRHGAQAGDRRRRGAAAVLRLALSAGCTDLETGRGRAGDLS